MAPVAYLDIREPTYHALLRAGILDTAQMPTPLTLFWLQCVPGIGAARAAEIYDAVRFARREGKR